LHTQGSKNEEPYVSSIEAELLSKIRSSPHVLVKFYWFFMCRVHPKATHGFTGIMLVKPMASGFTKCKDLRSHA
jgi:hypothetical protein